MSQRNPVRWFLSSLALWSFALWSIWAVLYLGFLFINWIFRVAV